MLSPRAQQMLPQHGLSRLAGRLATSRRRWLKNGLIRLFARIYPVDLSESTRTAIDDYASFNDFFTRELAAGRRPLPPDPALLVSPSDGAISAAGAVDGDTLLKAKGIRYSVATLLGDSGIAARFAGGGFATIYLAPADYHRVHAPATGVLRRSRAIPGALFSVNARTEAGVEGLFCRNERLVLEFETAFGALAVVLVGALVVASIDTPFGTPSSPFTHRADTSHDTRVTRGQEIGRFLVGSTVIVIWPEGAAEAMPSLRPGTRIRMGEPLARITRDRSETA
jgi:phosphatidylserine decarboxylase